MAAAPLAWTPDKRIAKWATARGFGQAAPMTAGQLREFAAMHNGKPRGIYMFECANHEVYIGISGASVATRLRSHLQTYADRNPMLFRFQPFDGDQRALRDRERELIWSSIWEEFTTLNREHGSGIIGTSSFDEVVPVARQTLWLADPVGENRRARYAVRTRTASELARCRHQFDRFCLRDDSQDIVAAVGTYLAYCTPFPNLTERSHWTLTCLPNVRFADVGWRRVATLSMAYIEMLWISQSPSGEVHLSVGTDFRDLPALFTKRKLRRVGATMQGVVHRSGGIYEEALSFESPRSLTAALENSPEIRMGAARHALDRMRKSAVSGRYAEAHNYLFAELALSKASALGLDIPV